MEDLKLFLSFIFFNHNLNFFQIFIENGSFINDTILVPWVQLGVEEFSISWIVSEPKTDLNNFIYICILSSGFTRLFLWGKALPFIPFFLLKVSSLLWKEITLVLFTLVTTKNCRRKFPFGSDYFLIS